MATIRERNGRFTAQIRKAGLNKAKTFDTREAANAWAAYMERVQSHADDLQVYADAHEDYKPSTVAEVLTKYLKEVTPTKRGWKQETQNIKQLLRDETWMQMPLQTLRYDQLKEWRDRRLTQVSASSVSRHFDIIRSAVRFAGYEWEWDINMAPFDKLRISKPKQAKKWRRIKQSDLQAIQRWQKPARHYARGSIRTTQPLKHC